VCRNVEENQPHLLAGKAGLPYTMSL
jgi:hypothetical protein